MVEYDTSMHLVVCLERKERQLFEDKANSLQQIMFNGILLFSFWCVCVCGEGGGRGWFVNEAESIFHLLEFL